MKHNCKRILRSYMARRLASARKQAHLTQANFSEKLMMDTRSYADLEHGRHLCCTLTFVIYLAFFCSDVNTLIQDLRQIILNSYDDVRSAS